MSAPAGREPEPLPLTRTKFERPRLRPDLVPRPRLLGLLDPGLDDKLILISAQAGAGKTTLLTQWLRECPLPSTWLSLDEHDNDLIVFLGYLIGAIRTVFPGACAQTHDLLGALPSPPLRPIVATLVNELADLAEPGLVLALDDYHAITDPAVHELMADLIRHLPQGIHLVLASRADPPLPLARLQARQEMVQVRSADLRFAPSEARALLVATLGRELGSETVAALEAQTAVWVVGLRLAALSLRSAPDERIFVQRFKATRSALIGDYMFSEVLARQSPEVQDFALRTSVLDRFCAPLCAAVTGLSTTKSQEILGWIAQANLFLVPLDAEGIWYRYHHLFQDLLRHWLKQRYSAADILALHARAGAWYADNEWLDEALHHVLAANDTPAAVDLVARQRYALMNQAQWPRLEQLLRQFPPDVIDQHPELIMLRTWLLYHRGQHAELPAALSCLEAALDRTSLDPQAAEHLQGEIESLRSLVSYASVDAKSTLAHAQRSLAKVPRELWIVRLLARMYLAGAMQMMGDLQGAYTLLYSGFEQEANTGNPFKATLLVTACNVHWLAADLHGIAQAAGRCIALSQDPPSPQMAGWGHYHLGRVRYQQDDLAAAEQHLTSVVQRPYLNYGLCYLYSACGLALTYQAQGRPQDAREAAEAMVAFMLETGNASLIPVARAFRAELDLRQGRIAQAAQWAAQLTPVLPLSPMHGLFAPHLTLVKVWLAQDTPASRAQAAELLGRLRQFLESTHNTLFTIETLALSALLNDTQDNQAAALAALGQAIPLAQPGGFVRLFVDLGPPLAHLLEQLRRRDVAPDYMGRILAAFLDQTTDHRPRTTSEPTVDRSSVVYRPPSPLEPLTEREGEVLALLARLMTNNEIARELVVSPSTVKTHTLNIYRKLKVSGRQQAVARAKELGILPPS